MRCHARRKRTDTPRVFYREKRLTGRTASCLYVSKELCHKERFNLFYIQLSSYTDDQWVQTTGSRRTESQQNWRGNELPREATPPLETRVPSFSHCLWGHCQRDLPGRRSVVGQDDLLAPSDTGILQLCLGWKISAYPPRPSQLWRGQVQQTVSRCLGTACETKSRLLYHNRFQKCRAFKTSPQNVIVYL